MRNVKQTVPPSMSPLTRTLAGASIPFVLVILYVIFTSEPLYPVVPTLDIGIEHTVPMTLEMTVTRNDTERMIAIGNDTLETIAVSVPEHWRRGEVRGAQLSAVIADAPAFGYIRWKLPAGAAVTFGSSHPFNKLNIHNPSGSPLKIRATFVDLLNNTGEHQVYLVKDGAVTIP